MEICETLFMGFVGIAAGMTVAGGVFTTLIAVGLIPRFAGKTHTGNRIFLYEEMVVAGTIVGTIFSIFFPFIKPSEWSDKSVIMQSIYTFLSPLLLGVFGLFAGIFVGCLALAIAEMLDTIPIFARRVKFRHGVGIAILSMAIGKTLGSLIYFIKQFFISGGV